MRSLRTALRTLPLLAVVVLVACDEEESGMLAPGDDPAESVLIHRTLTQVDRFGFPAVNTVAVSSPADKDVFNRSAPVGDAAFIPLAAGVLSARFALPEANATALAGILLPDVQPLGDLSGALFNGRRLADDVVDLLLGVLFGDGGLSSLAPFPPLASDNVDGNDVPFLGQFPYLAGPHTP